MRNADRIAEELRILRAARDGRLYMSDAGRWVIHGEARPEPKARKYLAQSERIGWPIARGPVRITDKGRQMLADHGAA